jgi:RNA 2',3'-cyclic 3'-phosphodiesterase
VSEVRARLFVALELPPPARSALIEWRAAALGTFTGLRLVAPESLHVTLCFLGWQEVAEIDPIASACGVVSEHRAAELSFGEPVWLPPRRPRVLAVGLEDPAAAVAEVQAALSTSLAKRGWFEPESRPFLPHVTVARVAKGARVSRDPVGAPAPMRLRASNVVLYRSRLGSAGARYEPLVRLDLEG